jgi:hypothetical protein
MKLACDFDEAYVEVESSPQFLPYVGGEPARLELCALAAKRSLGFALTAGLDPWIAAERIDVDVRGAEYIDSFPGEIRLQAVGDGASHWSAGTVIRDGGAIIVMNPLHTRERQKVTLAEELAHLVMGHPPCAIDAARGFRTFYEDVEDEAYGVGGAMVVPYAQLFWLAKKGVRAADIARQFGTSARFVDYRINRAGLRKMYRKQLRGVA